MNNAVKTFESGDFFEFNESLNYHVGKILVVTDYSLILGVFDAFYINSNPNKLREWEIRFSQEDSGYLISRIKCIKSDEDKLSILNKLNLFSN